MVTLHHHYNIRALMHQSPYFCDINDTMRSWFNVYMCVHGHVYSCIIVLAYTSILDIVDTSLEFLARLYSDQPVFLQVLATSHAIIVQPFCEKCADFVRYACRFHVIYMQISCKLLAKCRSCVNTLHIK